MSDGLKVPLVVGTESHFPGKPGSLSAPAGVIWGILTCNGKNFKITNQGENSERNRIGSEWRCAEQRWAVDSESGLSCWGRTERPTGPTAGKDEGKQREGIGVGVLPFRCK